METNNKNISILIVDDEPDIREILQFNLQNEGYDIDLAESSEQAAKMLTPKHRLILLDVMMGGISGFKFADQLRKDGNNIPIIFLTAKDTENDMLTGFSIGGDDYISKPFSIKEVVARVRSVLKRAENQSNAAHKNLLTVNNLEIDFDTKTVTVDKEVVELTKTEFNILVLLVQNTGRIFSRTDILDKAWKDDGIVLERTVDVHIARLRKKIGTYGDYIVNRTGYGYTFNLQNK
ncbi:MAG: response regulator transcription factor [Dysgonomonas sp.]|jgi:DNA-binding response OmpR family regulator|uniref:response regulator transcription factor n=1 Tax=unclassified Dysgonomonas TaxID=2630389 RepID=UPI0025B814D8|nr:MULTISPECIES: response regulator transcription factor [unclassified Dysgonomonas]MDR1714905.1 response regulator transcription factor [Prevotella sp.]MDR2004612.1 response regulator transcription factor [Prevotella sp.]HMM02123.1 response regulator transcription factor [Dysgonomonas sp.]